ncbi:THO complex subunit 4-like [Homalodisca vitripennis]|uniref:THO complex subunit 4-like n=1 Tax=Homalodisca vitripennis TaxID=197043 RepID=UPI001EEABA9E|nr:THO complex subunit 4-like [Homalodisca vitripennis]
MSLDDIIKQSEEFKNNASGGGGPMRSKRGRFSSAARTPYSQHPDDSNSRWQHDLYNGRTLYNSRGAGGLSMTGGGANTSRLKPGLWSIKFRHAESGPLHSATVNYDKSGRSMGSAYVVFHRKADAVKAMKQYNSVPLDDTPKF